MMAGEDRWWGLTPAQQAIHRRNNEAFERAHAQAFADALVDSYFVGVSPQGDQIWLAFERAEGEWVHISLDVLFAFNHFLASLMLGFECAVLRGDGSHPQ